MSKIDELYKKMDEVIIRKHSNMRAIIEMARKEFDHEPFEHTEKGLLILEMENLGKLYRELQESIKNAKFECYVNKLNAFSADNITIDMLTAEQRNDAIKDGAIAVFLRDNLLDHIREGYEQMGFISQEEYGEPSIYEGEKEEALRELEYESYKIELDTIFSRQELELDSPQRYSLSNVALIVQDIAEKEGYDKAVKILEKVQGQVEDEENPKFNSLSKDKKDGLRHQIIYRKYEEMFKYYDSVNCGLLLPDMRETRILNQFNKFGNLQLLFGVPDNELKKLHGFIVGNYVDTLKDDITGLVRGIKSDNRVPRRKIDVLRDGTNRFIEDTLLKSREIGKKARGFVKDTSKKVKENKVKKDKGPKKESKRSNNATSAKKDKDRIKEDKNVSKDSGKDSR